MISFTMKLLSIFSLVLLPPQKAQLQSLKRRGGSSFWAAVIMVVLFNFALIWSVLTNVMAMAKSTACYRIAGGIGCNK